MARTRRTARKSTLASSHRVASPSLMIKGTSAAMEQAPAVGEDQYRDIQEVPEPQAQPVVEQERNSDSDSEPSKEEEEENPEEVEQEEEEEQEEEQEEQDQDQEGAAATNTPPLTSATSRQRTAPMFSYNSPALPPGRTQHPVYVGVVPPTSPTGNNYTPVPPNHAASTGLPEGAQLISGWSVVHHKESGLPLEFPLMLRQCLADAGHNYINSTFKVTESTHPDYPPCGVLQLDFTRGIQ